MSYPKMIVGIAIIGLLTGCQLQSPAVTSVTEQPATPAEETSPIQPVKAVITDPTAKVQERAAEVVTAVTDPAPAAGLPATFDHADMAFARQAPFGDWSEVNEEMCEEASLIIADQFFRGQPLDEAIMKELLPAVKEWEEGQLGVWESTTAEQTAQLAREYFHLSTAVTNDVTVERIKQELVAGKLIVLPLAGQELHNPNYTGAGPLYHMLVVRGYDRDQFITNDPGTRLGRGYKYAYDVLLNAVHDWNGGDVLNGARVMLIISPPTD